MENAYIYYMFLSDIVGQQEVKNRLLKMVGENRLPHALLFNGVDGSGNLATAVAFAQYLFCSNRQAHDSCGTCPSCIKTSKLIHPDLHFVFPIIKSKYVKSSADLIKEFREAFLEAPYLNINDWCDFLGAENKQPIIPVEESGNIIRELSYTSYEGLYKMMIIWQPEKMNTEAANRLLKVLEEPPEQTIFMLVCNNPDALLSTIISRVQQIPFTRLKESEITDALIKKYGVTQDNATQAAFLCDGNFNEAIKQLTQNDEQLSFLEHFQSFMRLALKFDGGQALLWVDQNAANGREKHKQFLHYSLEIFRDSLMYNFGSRDLVRLGGRERKFLEKFAPFVSQKNYEKLVEEFNSSYYYVERNANPKILFMDLLLKTNELINLK
ncbi:MAG TPA: DNA polymerase III subunit delta' [Bacteroidia bacterium]|jgi:DNA polymerase-3 subunit delta'|nr:DNA polymerase III subunit delta' [Bacteroidia bacterium]